MNTRSMKAFEEPSKQHPDHMYQVSGHSKMYCLNNGKIAKVSNENEKKCYQLVYRLNSGLKKYIATYYGAYIVESSTTDPDSFVLRRTESSKIDSIDNTDVSHTSLSLKEDIGNRYIVLSDLESLYQFPCMLDIKVGTRMHWDGASERKVKRHTQMCKMTTSGSLGLRICGMRLYSPHTKSWIYKEKKWGKSIISDEMYTALQMFFYDGRCIRKDLFPSILEQLCEIRAMVQSCNWRFWSSSLLFTYEGSGSCRCDINLIDFANCNFCGNYTTPDEGYLFGLNNLIAYIRLIANNGEEIDQSTLVQWERE